VTNTLLPNERLSPGQSLTSQDGRFTLILRGDGNLVLYQGSMVLWKTNTVGLTPGFLGQQGSDGNLVLYVPGLDGPRAVWNAGTAGHPNNRLVLQDDGNLVVYDGGAVVWATYTFAGRPVPEGFPLTGSPLNEKRRLIEMLRERADVEHNASVGHGNEARIRDMIAKCEANPHVTDIDMHGAFVAINNGDFALADKICSKTTNDPIRDNGDDDGGDDDDGGGDDDGGDDDDHGIHGRSRRQRMEPFEMTLGTGRLAAPQRRSERLGPAEADRQVRRTIRLCWAMLPEDRRTKSELEKQVRRIVDRAIRDLHDDLNAFRPDTRKR